MISTYDIFLVVAAVLTNTSVIFFFWGMNKRHACCGEVRLISVFWSTALWWQRVCVLTQVMSGLLMEHSAKYLEEDLSCYQTPLGEFQISSAVLAEGWGREGGGRGEAPSFQTCGSHTSVAKGGVWTLTTLRCGVSLPPCPSFITHVTQLHKLNTFFSNVDCHLI